MSNVKTVSDADRARIRAGVASVLAVAETIRELGSVPSGHLYAQLLGTLSLENYESIIRTLRGAGLVEEKNHVFVWTGPRLASAPQ